MANTKKEVLIHLDQKFVVSEVVDERGILRSETQARDNNPGISGTGFSLESEALSLFIWPATANDPSVGKCLFASVRYTSGKTETAHSQQYPLPYHNILRQSVHRSQRK